MDKTNCQKKGKEKWRGKACISHRTDRPTKFSSWRQAHRRRSSRLWLRRFVVCTASLNARVGTHPASSMAGAAHLTGGITQPPKKVGLYDPAFERDACGIGFIADLKRRPTRSTVVVSALRAQLSRCSRCGPRAAGGAAPARPRARVAGPAPSYCQKRFPRRRRAPHLLPPVRDSWTSVRLPSCSTHPGVAGAS